MSQIAGAIIEVRLGKRGNQDVTSRQLVCFLRMKYSLLLLVLALVACHHVDDTDSDPCLFAADTLAKDAPVLDLSADSTRTYSYQFAQSNPDSILKSLCTKGIAVQSAYNDADYLCKDAIGPRFVVVLDSPNGAILSENFALGNMGRFACATKVVRYLHITPINESH
jgi:hypothetical protein